MNFYIKILVFTKFLSFLKEETSFDTISIIVQFVLLKKFVYKE